VEGGYLAQVITPKGEALLAHCAATEASAAAVAQAETARQQARQKAGNNAPAIPDGFAAWLEENFDHPAWKTMALRCHGCGACTGVCPTCHCFDIVDEHDSSDEGLRRRNWDSCQTAKFTLQASGHNPRQSQSERFRQRIQHKFSIYPKRFGEILCTGCGRCCRVCPGGMDLPEILGGLIALAKKGPQESGR
jgi:ferredoxin